MPEYSSVAVVGVGLIGGSIGLALRERRLAREVVGVGRREVSLRQARERGAVDQTTTDLAAGVAETEIVVVCTPVGTIAEHALAAAAACPAESLITDAGSTKAEIVAAVEAEDRKRGVGTQDDGRTVQSGWNAGGPCQRAAFVGSHPLAGDHRTGVAHARADLFEGRTVVVTPTGATSPTAIERACEFWRALGADVSLMEPDEHDRLVAVTSHAPHLVAAAVVAATPDEAQPLTASGWRDVTRIAAGDPELWRAIIAANREHVLDALLRVDGALTALRAAIETGDDAQLVELLTEAKRMRENAGG